MSQEELANDRIYDQIAQDYARLDMEHWLVEHSIAEEEMTQEQLISRHDMLKPFVEQIKQKPDNQRTPKDNWLLEEYRLCGERAWQNDRMICEAMGGACLDNSMSKDLEEWKEIEKEFV